MTMTTTATTSTEAADLAAGTLVTVVAAGLAAGMAMAMAAVAATTARTSIRTLATSTLAAPGSSFPTWTSSSCTRRCCTPARCFSGRVQRRSAIPLSRGCGTRRRIPELRRPYTEDLFCSGHAFLPDGRLCVPGGAPSGSMDSTHIFDPVSESWAKVADMNQARWYPTVLTLPDGRILAASGSGASEVEVYDAGANTWRFVTGATRMFPELYPSLHQLPSGQIFHSRCGWAMADTVNTQTGTLALSGPTTGVWNDLGLQQFHDRQEGTAVLQIDATVTPPVTKVYVVGGGVSGAATARNPQSMEIIDLTTPGAGTAWDTPSLTMNYPRTNVNAVLLPDGTVFIVGGQRAGKWNFTDPQPVLEGEIFDPATGTFAVTTPMQFPRQYHSVAVLLPDGRVLSAGGVDPTNPVERDLRQLEVFSPGYVAAAGRPQISSMPATATYGATFGIASPDGADVASVALIRPNSVTHHTDAGHRYIKVLFTTTPTGVDVTVPATAEIAPPGYYLLFLVTADGVPSIGEFVQIS